MADGMIFQVIKVKVKLHPHKIRKFKMEILNNKSINNKLKKKKANNNKLNSKSKTKTK